MDGMQVGPPVGVVGLEQDMQDWYSQQPLTLGMGYRPCDKLDPAMQVTTLLCLHCLLHCFIPAARGRPPPFPPLPPSPLSDELGSWPRPSMPGVSCRQQPRGCMWLLLLRQAGCCKMATPCPAANNHSAGPSGNGLQRKNFPLHSGRVC